MDTRRTISIFPDMKGKTAVCIEHQDNDGHMRTMNIYHPGPMRLARVAQFVNTHPAPRMLLGYLNAQLWPTIVYIQDV
jgi:hypothetical protein